MGISGAVKNIESLTEVLKDLLNNVQSGNGLARNMLENKQLTTNVQAIANKPLLHRAIRTCPVYGVCAVAINRHPSRRTGRRQTPSTAEP
jgi:hypothetical protein